MWYELQSTHSKPNQQSQIYQLMDIPHLQDKGHWCHVNPLEVACYTTPWLLLSTMDSSKRCLIQQLEQLQKSFLNGIPSLNHLNYWEKLNQLKIYSLERRRDRYRIIYTWCILENIAPNFNYNGDDGDVILQKWHKFLAHLSKVALGYKKKKKSC